MHEFFLDVLEEFLTGLVAAALVMLPMAIGVWLWHRKRGGKLNWKRLIPLALLVCYTVVVLRATLFRTIPSAGLNTHLFRAWKEAWCSFSTRAWGNILLNIAMFMPLGVLIHLAFPKCRGLRTILVMLGATALLESVQFFGTRGVFDVDDLFANALGGLMGWCMLMAVLSARDKKWFAGTAWFILAMIPVAAVGGMFMAYRCQPYGNLPEAYTYRVNTENIEWVLECSLPEAQETAAVYKSSGGTKAECDAVAEKMAECWGGAYDDIYYYDDAIYYRDYEADGWMYYLTLSRLDGSFDFWAEKWDGDYIDASVPEVWADLSRAETEAVLAQYGITIPAQAQFRELAKLYPDFNDLQAIIFSLEDLVTEDGMVDGECHVRINEDGTCIEVENRMVTYRYKTDEPIRTPEEALQMLRDGYFGKSWRYIGFLCGQYSIRSCTLGFALDTKGFYQPVYYFEVEAPDWYGPATIMIPAIA